MLNYVESCRPCLMALRKTIHNFKGGHLRTVSVNFGSNWISIFIVVEENVKFPIGFNVKLCRAMAAILDDARQNRTQFLEGTSQGTFLQILAKIGSAVSEELMKMKIPIG